MVYPCNNERDCKTGTGSHLCPRECGTDRLLAGRTQAVHIHWPCNISCRISRLWTFRWKPIARAAYDHIIKRNDVDPTQIVLFGRSLGGGVVCALAAKRPCAALILMSTFTSTRSFANKFLIPSILILDPFDNLKFIESFSGPTLIIHGRNDDLVPYRHGVRLHRAAKHSKMLTYDCNHNDCPPNWNRFWQDVESFLVKNLTK
ncbi:MAG: alpha/beta hydrolase [Deltaproteobacteria bacterium]|nr:alpha/beta hydrolase [Deltaproteobacteria bacterium]